MNTLKALIQPQELMVRKAIKCEGRGRRNEVGEVIWMMMK